MALLQRLISSDHYRSLSSSWTHFFQKAPLLLQGLSFLFGIVLALEMRPVIALVSLLLLLIHSCLYAKAKDTWVPILFFIMGALYISITVKEPPKGSLLNGTAFFCPDSIHPSLSSKESISFRGTLKYFIGPEGEIVARNIPCAFLVKNLKSPLPSPDSDWVIKGSLQDGKGRFWKLKPSSTLFWKEETKSYSWIKHREKLKALLEKFIQKNIQGERNQHLIAGMVTGSFADQEIGQAFQRFGLQHILAISGFHFSLFALIATLLLKPIFQGRTLLFFLTLCVTSYFFFLGPTPSIQRAWVMIILSLAASLAERRISPFNALGAALFLTLLSDPLSFKSPGFTLSFAITFSILAFTAPCSTLLGIFFPERSYKEASGMDMLDKTGLIAFTAVKKMTALNLAVHVTALPLTLALFGSFPLLSPLFNLFFPTLAGLVIFLFIISALSYALLEPLGTLLFSLTSQMTNLLLSFALDMPDSWNIQVAFPLAADWAILIAFTLLVAAVFSGEKPEELYTERPIL